MKPAVTPKLVWTMPKGLKVASDPVRWPKRNQWVRGFVAGIVVAASLALITLILVNQ